MGLGARLRADDGSIIALLQAACARLADQAAVHSAGGRRPPGGAAGRGPGAASRRRAGFCSALPDGAGPRRELGPRVPRGLPSRPCWRRVRRAPQTVGPRRHGNISGGGGCGPSHQANAKP